MLHIAEYRRKMSKLADHVPWAVFLADGFILNKDGSFQATYRFRGPDRESSTDAQLVAYRAQLNNAMRRLGTRWAVFIEAQRFEESAYPSSEFPDPVTHLIDAQRRLAVQTPGACFDTEYFVTFVYLPPSDQTSWAQQLFYKSDSSPQAIDYRRQLQYFQDQVRSVTGVLRGLMPMVESLDTAQTLTYLHHCVSNRRMTMSAPEVPAFVDALVCDCPVQGGLSLKLGDRFIKVVSVRGYPGRTVPALLDGLNQLPLPYRWVVRWMPLSHPDALTLLHKTRAHWFRKRKSLTNLFKEAVLRQEQVLEDPDALVKVADADAALEELGDGGISFGFLTLSVTVWGNDEPQATEQAKKVQDIVDSQGLASTIETVNGLEAFLGSLPGQVYANVRGPLMMSLNLCDLLPAHAVWSGPKKNDHLGGPVLLRCKSRGSTPFNFSHFYQDVGHLVVLGPTGSGKTTLLNLMVAQFRRYPRSQVFIFDKGCGTRALTLAVGGDFYDLGFSCGGRSGGGSGGASEDGLLGVRGQGQAARLAFQPLAGVDQEAERRWAQEWLLSVLAHEGVAVNPQLKTALWKALENLGSRSDPRERTISVFVGMLQHQQAKEALRHYTHEGAYGHVFDADHEELSHSDWQTFEIEGLLANKALAVPLLTYLFHRLEERFDAGRPTMLVLDEVWLVLLNAFFAAKLVEWLKVLRKKNVSVVFATQSLADVIDSPAAATVVDNCPTRVFLANPQAMQPEAYRLYDAFGLNTKQVQVISKATPKRHYYFHSPEGNRLFELGLSEVELAFLGAGSAEDQQRIDQLLAQGGAESFAQRLLRSKGLHVTAEQLATTNALDGGPHYGSKNSSHMA